MKTVIATAHGMFMVPIVNTDFWSVKELELQIPKKELRNWLAWECMLRQVSAVPGVGLQLWAVKDRTINVSNT